MSDSIDYSGYISSNNNGSTSSTEDFEIVDRDFTGITQSSITIISPSDENLPAVQSEEFLPSISRWMTFGGIFLLATLLSGVVLAAITKYRIAVTSPGIIRPIGEVRLIQSASAGQISTIIAKENQAVNKGDVIATLDNSQLVAKKNQLVIKIQQIQLQQAQANAQIASIDWQMRSETEQNQRSIAAERARLSLSKRNYRDKQITSVAAASEAQANVKAAENEWQKARTQLKSITAEYRSAQVLLRSALAKQTRYASVAKLGAISQDQYEEAKLAFGQQQEKVLAQKATIESQQMTIAQLGQNVLAAKAKLKSIQANLDPSTAEVSIASENIARSQATGSSALAVLKREKEGSIQKRIELDRELTENKRELRQTEIALRQTHITATVGGIITKLSLRNSGQVVKLGDEIAQIVPSGNALAIDTNISPAEIGKLKRGQRVEMQVSACPYPEYGTLTGTVDRISADTIQSPSAIETKPTISAYKVTIKPKSLELVRGQKKCQIRLGMEGKTEIIAGEETFLQFLLRKAGLSLVQ
jgi:multidrug efflux pump subunit AcrA (membrane-fusion protein)